MRWISRSDDLPHPQLFDRVVVTDSGVTGGENRCWIRWVGTAIGMLVLRRVTKNDVGFEVRADDKRSGCYSGAKTEDNFLRLSPLRLEPGLRFALQDRGC